MINLFLDGKVILDAGIASMPLFWRIWLYILGGVNLLAVVFIKKREAQITLVFLVVNFILMSILAANFGFTKILGVGHFPWIILVVYLYGRLGKIPMDTLYGKWVRLLMIVITISLVIDVVDVIRYFIGV